MIVYSIENISKFYFSPCCEYKIFNNICRFYNYMQKREIIVNIERKLALELINSLKKGINYDELVALLEKCLIDETAEKFVSVLLANGIIE